MRSDGGEATHSKYASLIDFIEDRPKASSSPRSKSLPYESLVSNHDSNAKVERALAAYGATGGRLDLERLIEVHQVRFKRPASYARMKSVAEWLVSTDCDSTLQAIMDAKNQRKLLEQRSKEQNDLIQQRNRKAILEEIVKKEQASRKITSSAKTSVKALPRDDWGRTKPSKLEDDGNSWREQT